MSATWLLVINPTSGNGKGEKIGQRVLTSLQRRNVDFITIIEPSATDLSARLLREIELREVSGIIAVGGDGLVHLVLQLCVPAHIPFAVIPAGTGNDFLRTLGWSLENFEPFLDRILNSEAEEIDLGLVDSEWFGAILSTGFDSVVNERANRLKFPKGPSRYNYAIALELPRFQPIEYSITCDGQLIKCEAMLVAIGNGKSYGGGMNICPQAQIHDGLFDVVILEPVSKVEFLKVFPKVYSGSHISHPQVRSLRASKVTIEADAIAYADGERIGPAPITAECVPGAGLTWTL